MATAKIGNERGTQGVSGESDKAKAPEADPAVPNVQDEPGAEQRFAKGIANALRMPPKSHKAMSTPAPDKVAKRSKKD